MANQAKKVVLVTARRRGETKEFIFTVGGGKNDHVAQIRKLNREGWTVVKSATAYKSGSSVSGTFVERYYSDPVLRREQEEEFKKESTKTETVYEVETEQGKALVSEGVKEKLLEQQKPTIPKPPIGAKYSIYDPTSGSYVTSGEKKPLGLLQKETQEPKYSEVKEPGGYYATEKDFKEANIEMKVQKRTEELLEKQKKGGFGGFAVSLTSQLSPTDPFGYKSFRLRKDEKELEALNRKNIETMVRFSIDDEGEYSPKKFGLKFFTKAPLGVYASLSTASAVAGLGFTKAAPLVSKSVSKLPAIPQAIVKGGGLAIKGAFNDKFFVTSGLAAIEATKVKRLKEAGYSNIDIEAELLKDVVYSQAITSGFYSGRKMASEFRTFGMKKVPKEQLIPEDVLSGKARFPEAGTKQMSSLQRAKVHKQLFETKTFRLPGQTTPLGYHTTGQKWNELVAWRGTSELPGTYVSYGISPHFARLGTKPNFKLFGSSIGGGVATSPTIYGFEPAGIEINIAKRNIGGWSFTKPTRPGAFNVPGMKTEVEAVIKPGTTFKETGLSRKFYTEIGGFNVPIVTAQPTGFTSTGNIGSGFGGFADSLAYSNIGGAEYLISAESFGLSAIGFKSSISSKQISSKSYFPKISSKKSNIVSSKQISGISSYSPKPSGLTSKSLKSSLSTSKTTKSQIKPISSNLVSSAPRKTTISAFKPLAKSVIVSPSISNFNFPTSSPFKFKFDTGRGDDLISSERIFRPQPLAYKPSLTGIYAKRKKKKRKKGVYYTGLEFRYPKF